MVRVANKTALPAQSINRSQRRRLKRVGYLLMAALILFATLAGSGYLYLRRSLPQEQGDIKVPVLGASVEIVRDRDAVPHIYAATTTDAYCGLGYVHAQERLWQMEFQRRVAQGRLAEILGPTAIQRDRLLRTLGVYRAAVKAWETFPTASKEIVSAYVAGINAFINSHSGAGLPPEFTWLRISPEAWNGADVLAWVKMLAWNLDSLSYASELLASDIDRAVGADGVRQLMPDYPTDAPRIVSASAGGRRDREAASAIDEMRALVDAGLVNDGDLGSNSWVVDGTKSLTGKPILANDPHLWTTMPGNWYVAHLSCAGLDVIGATIPGLPMILMGRNRHIAWGITHLAADVQDLYQERFDATGRMTEYRGRFEPLQITTEIIQVRGESDVAHIVRATRHGPLISDPLNTNDAAMAPAQRQGQLAPLALRWPALDSQDATIDAFLRINRAQNWSEFRDALRGFVAPGLNFVYADTANNIGYCAAGLIPARAERAGQMPAEGWSGANEWAGYIPFDELPQSYNPPAHFIVTANNYPVTGANHHYLGAQWAAPYRAERIKELIESKPALGLDDNAAIQGDTVSLEARELTPLLLNMVEPQNEDERLALELLRAWDGDARGDSAAAAIFEVWSARLPRAILSDDLGPALLARYERRFDYLSRFLTRVFEDKSVRWCDDRSTPEPGDCAAIAERALNDTLQFLRSEMGGNMQRWRWDQIHVAIFPHPLSEDNAILPHFLNRSIANGGDRSTVNIGPFTGDQRFEQRAAPGYRQLIDLSNAEPDRFIETIGQSGHPLSPHYDDYLADWQAVRYRPLRFDRTTIDQAGATVLRLVP